jgi:hypothetical protein
LQHIEIPLPPDIDLVVVERAIDALIADRGLQVALRGSLKKHPGCIHWHVKQAQMPGTLEITVWPAQHRAWFSVQRGRRAAWIDGEIARLQSSIKTHLSRR